MDYLFLKIMLIKNNNTIYIKHKNYYTKIIKISIKMCKI